MERWSIGTKNNMSENNLDKWAALRMLATYISGTRNVTIKLLRHFAAKGAPDEALGPLKGYLDELQKLHVLVWEKVERVCIQQS